MKSNWNLKELKDTLTRSPEWKDNLRGWMITEEHVKRQERYFLCDTPGNSKTLARDQDREVNSVGYTLHLIVKTPPSSEGKETQGEIVTRLHTAQPLRAQLELAYQSACETRTPQWNFHTITTPTQDKKLKTVDPRIFENLGGVMDDLTQQLFKEVQGTQESIFNSSELFISLVTRHRHWSHGLTDSSTQSRIYAEVAYSSSAKERSDEFLSRQWAVGLHELSLHNLCQEASTRAAVTRETRMPEPGRMAVLIDAESLSTLMNDFCTPLSAANKYYSLPFREPGSTLIPGAEGDRITMTLDPFFDFGGDTCHYSSQAVPQKKLLLVDNNQVSATLTEKQFSDYLHIPASTTCGTIVVSPGKRSYQELLKSAPQVLEVYQFSSLNTDPNRGVFSSEIRLGCLHDNVRGTKHAIKGGALAGSLFENFKRSLFSSETSHNTNFSPFGTHREGQSYFGPKYALLNDISISA